LIRHVERHVREALGRLGPDVAVEVTTFVGAETLIRVSRDADLLVLGSRRYGPLRAVADFIFIRRALRDSLRRTLRRFAVEAAEEARLPR
jgi:hypothetical protein